MLQFYCDELYHPASFNPRGPGLIHSLLADAVLVLHASFVAFVVFGLVLILAGLVRRWQWVRNPWFRALHLLAIGMVVAQAWAGVHCPLTILENRLRLSAGQNAYADGWVAHWVGRFLFFEAEPWVFVFGYSLFGALVLVTFLIGPPRWQRQGS